MTSVRYSHKIDEEVIPKQSWKEFAVDQLLKTLPEFGGVQMEDLEAQPASKGWGIRLAFLYIFGFMTTFATLTYWNTNQLTETIFLSASGNISSQFCLAVPVVQTASFEATTDGYWATESGFSKNKSLLLLSFTGSAVTLPQYTASMQSFADQMVVLGKKGSTRNLAWNAVAYAQYGFTDVATKMTWYASTDSGIIFNSKVYIAAFSSRGGICRETDVTFNSSAKWTSATFDKGSRSLVVSMPVYQPRMWIENTLQSSQWAKMKETCPLQFYGITDSGMLDPFLPENRGGTVDLKFDIRSVVMTVALNLGITDTSTLLRVDSPPIDFYNLTAWIDPAASPEMDPVYCIDKSNPYFGLSDAQKNGPEICFLNVGFFYFFYPMVQQLANSATQKTCGVSGGEGIKMRYPCKCPGDTFTVFCQSQDFYIGLLFDQQGRDKATYSKQTYTSTANTLRGTMLKPPIQLGLKFQKFMLDDPDDGDIAAMDAVGDVFAYTAITYNNLEDVATTQTASTTSTPAGSCTKYDGAVWDIGGKSFNTKLQEAWDVLCDWKTCSGLVLRLRNDDYLNNLFLPINKYGVAFSHLTSKTIPNPGFGAGYISQRLCNDMFSLPDAMARLAKFPPVPVIEPYNLCTYTLESALLSALGTSASLAGLILSLFFGGLGFCMIRVQNHRLRNESHYNRLLDKNQKQALQNDATHHIISGLVKELRLHRELLADWQAQVDLNYDPTLDLALSENRRKWDKTVSRMAAFKKLYKSLHSEDPDQPASLLSRDSVYLYTEQDQSTGSAVGARNTDTWADSADSDVDGFDSDSGGEEEEEEDENEQAVTYGRRSRKARLREQQLALAQHMAKRMKNQESADDSGWCGPGAQIRSPEVGQKGKTQTGEQRCL